MLSRAWNSPSLRGASRVASTLSYSVSTPKKDPALSKLCLSDNISSRRLGKPGRAGYWGCDSSSGAMLSSEGASGHHGMCVSSCAGGRMAPCQSCPVAMMNCSWRRRWWVPACLESHWAGLDHEEHQRVAHIASRGSPRLPEDGDTKRNC